MCSTSDASTRDIGGITWLVLCVITWIAFDKNLQHINATYKKDFHCKKCQTKLTFYSAYFGVIIQFLLEISAQLGTLCMQKLL